MKIAILHSGNLERVSPGGISQYIEKIIKYNVDNEITLFGVEESGKNCVLWNKYNKKIDFKDYTFIPIQTNSKKPLSIYYFFNILKKRKLFNEYDIIFAQRMEYALPFTFNKNRKKLIMAIHGSGKYSYLYWGKLIGTIYNLVERIAVKNCKKVIVLLKRTEYGLPYYKNKFKKQINKFRYGKVPIDIEVFKSKNKDKVRKELGFNHEDKIIIYFGRLDNNPKRILLLPQIVKNIKYNLNEIKCIVIGDGEDKTLLKNMCIEKGLDKQFVFLDKLEHGDKLVKYISCADISIILSTFEGICMSALESLAVGVPVITTDVGDVNEYIIGKANGYVINNQQDEIVVQNFTKKLLEFFNETDKVYINDIYKEYTGSVVMEELNGIFEEVYKGE